MKKLLLILLFVPLLSLGQSSYTSYYENGNLKVTGEGFFEEIKWKISAKSGLTLRESPDIKSKKIAKIPYGTFVSIKSKTDLKFTIIDTDKETGITKSIQGKWVKIAAKFFLGPGDKGYYEDLIEPSGVEGYVFDGFLKEERYLVHKPGVWTYYFESGVINQEVFYSEEGVIKKITYDTDGDINKIEEHKEDDLWGSDVIVTFYKNGKVKNMIVAENGGAVETTFDENGNILEGGFGIDMNITLSKDIKDFYFTHSELEKNRIELEQKPIAKLTEFKNGRWISTIDSLSGVEIRNGKWIMFYKTGETESTNVYDFKIRREFIQESGALYKPLEYLTITNDQSGPLEYYIIEYSKELLSLSYTGRGNTLNYKPEKVNDEEDEFDGVNLTFLEKYNNTIWTDGLKTLRFRKLSSIKHSESTKEIKGYVFDGFLKKSAGNGKFYNDKGYFIIKDKIENLNKTYDINAKNGLNVRESPSTSGKIVNKLENGITVKILKKTGEFFEVEGIKGEWVEIETYNPSGERQQLGLNSIFDSVFTEEVPDESTLLECTMCGYQRITKNEGNTLAYENLVRNDFGDIEDFYTTYSISNDVLDDGSNKYVSINSDSNYIEEIKDINKKLKVYSNKKKDSIAKIQIIKNKIAQEQYDFEEMEYFFTWNAVFVENPKSSSDFEINGFIKFFKSKNESAALLDFNKSIELNPNSNGIIYFIRGLIKKNLNIKGFCDDLQKASDLEYFSAKEIFRNTCKLKSCF